MSQVPGFVVVYRWRVHPGLEQSFIDAWSARTRQLLQMKGSLGSRLHRGADGTWYSYAQWASAEDRARAFAQPSDPDLRARMGSAIAESFPELVLECVSDYLSIGTGSEGAEGGAAKK